VRAAVRLSRAHEKRASGEFRTTGGPRVWVEERDGALRP
jgi:hypothetical protein